MISFKEIYAACCLISAEEPEIRLFACIARISRVPLILFSHMLADVNHMLTCAIDNVHPCFIID